MAARVTVLVGAVLLSLAQEPSAAQRGRGWGNVWTARNVDYDGRFVFTRIRYDWNSWNHDYPRADRHLPVILQEVTDIEANTSGSDVYDLSDPNFFTRPVIYISEPGFWMMNDEEVQNLRRYLLKGGFAILDDFEREHLYNVQVQLRRALPEHKLIQIDITHPIFHSFFEMKKIDFPHPMDRVIPNYYGLFEDNDPTQRMLAIVNHNNDIAEYWEWSDTGWLPIDITNEAYKLGVNYIIYAMTH